MARYAPQAFRNEAAFAVYLCPLTVSKGPRIRQGFAPLEVLIGPLLIVRSELSKYSENPEQCQSFIGCSHIRPRLKASGIRRESK